MCSNKYSEDCRVTVVENHPIHLATMARHPQCLNRVTVVENHPLHFSRVTVERQPLCLSR